MAVDLSTRPTERADAYEDAWSSMVASWWSDGVWPAQFNRGEVFADGSGPQVKIRSLKVNIQGFHGEKSTETTLGVSNADPSNPRIDRIVARLDRTKPATIRLDVITGTPAASPSAPPLVRNSTTYDISLATVTRPTGVSSVQATHVVDDREYAAPRVTDQVGVVKQYLGTVAPEGYLLMAGQTVNKADYPALARLLSVTTPTFIVPDMRGRYAQGADSTASPGAIGGAATMTLGVTHMPAHAHGVNDPTHRHGYNGDINLRFVVTQSPSSVWTTQGTDPSRADEVTYAHMDNASTGISIQSAGNGTPFSLYSPYRAMNFIVKAH